MDFEHYDDQSVEVAVDLVNSYGTRPRRVAGRAGQPLPSLAAFFTDHDLTPAQFRPEDVAAAQRIADRLHDVFATSDAAEAVETLNEILAQHGAAPRVTQHDGTGWHLHYDPSESTAIDRLAVSAAMGLATVLCLDGLTRFGACDARDCGGVYVDTSRNRCRRYCSDGCTNRANVAAFRARRKLSQQE